jgi:hypothetical protein
MAVQVREPEAVPSTQPWGAMVTMARTAGPMDPMGLTPAPMGPTEPMESMAPMGPMGSLDPMATPAMASLGASHWGPLDTSMPLWAMGQARPTASGGMICNSAESLSQFHKFSASLAVDRVAMSSNMECFDWETTQNRVGRWASSTILTQTASRESPTQECFRHQADTT